jgi:MAF protein
MITHLKGLRNQVCVRIACMLVLASGSPRRKQLMTLGGWSFQSYPVEIDETPIPGETAKDYVLRLAKEKAVGAAQKFPPGKFVIAADTAVVDGGKILGKPANKMEAFEMLRGLRARIHQVFTALALLPGPPNKLVTDVCITNVWMRDYGDSEMQTYIDSGDPLDKAGAYAIQHSGFNPVERLEGCYANVVGLPVCHLTHLLARFDIFPPENAIGICQDTTNYQCTLKTLVLSE